MLPAFKDTGPKPLPCQCLGNNATDQMPSASTADKRRAEGERATRAVTALVDAFAGIGAGRKARPVQVSNLFTKSEHCLVRQAMISDIPSILGFLAGYFDDNARADQVHGWLTTYPACFMVIEKPGVPATIIGTYKVLPLSREAVKLVEAGT